MPALNLSIPHNLGQAAAQQRVAHFLESVRRDYAAELDSAEGSWTGNVLQFAIGIRGFTTSGTLTVEETAVHVASSLPFAAMFFRGRIEQTIRDELQKLLG